MTMKIALGIEYDGSGYHGWQRQDHDGLLTVQGSLEEALSRVANEPVEVSCAGRTDAGVHGLGQVVHFDTNAIRSEYSWVFGPNSNMLHDINVVWAKTVDETFHARFSATARSYRYVIYNHPIRPSLWRHYATWYHRPLNEKRMHRAAACLLGKHDFSSFRSVDCQAKTPLREIKQIKVHRQDQWVILDIKADGFLHHMVRNIVGVLLEIGEERRDPIWMEEVLQAKDRRKAGVTAPANGLYLVAVDYPDKYQLPKRTGSKDVWMLEI